MTIGKKREIVRIKSVALIAFQDTYFTRKSLAKNVPNLVILNVEYVKGKSMLNENERSSDIRRMLDGKKAKKKKDDTLCDGLLFCLCMAVIFLTIALVAGR